jgi:colicin import membrane protein
MKTDRLYSSLFFSLSLHSLLVLAVVAYMMYSGAHYKAAVFDVSLVSPTENSPSAGMPRSVEAPVEAPKKEKRPQTAEKKPEMVTPQEKSAANERIAALEAKRKIESMQRLRKSIDISAKGTSSSTGQTSVPGTPGGPDYGSMIGSIIHEKFRIPESMDKDLLAIINIRIARNGNVTILGFEKKSGNALYDRAAIKAITDASPLPPPPSEMERAIRLRP